MVETIGYTFRQVGRERSGIAALGLHREGRNSLNYSEDRRLHIQICTVLFFFLQSQLYFFSKKTPELGE